MQFFYKEKKVRNGYISAFGLLMISYFLVFITIHQLEKRSQLVNHTSEIINNLDILFSCLKEAETTFRAYVIVEDSVFLTPYEFHLNCIHSSFDELRRLLENNPSQLHKLDSLNILIGLKLTLLQKSIDDTKLNRLEQPVIRERIRDGYHMMEKIRTQVFKMQTHENEDLASRSKEFEVNTRALKIIHFSTFIISLLLVIYSVVIFNNVSKANMLYRKQLNEGIDQLKTANNDLVNLRSIEKFAASGRIARTIAHEIRNPLTSISLATEQLAADVKSEEDSTMLEIISRNVQRIHNLILSLLNSTKFSNLKLQKIPLNTIVEQALDLAKDRMELHGITVNRNLSPNPCHIEADQEKMTTAILNIIVNAIEAMEQGKGILEVTTIRNNDKCIVWIKDNGVGMDDSLLSRIFDPYFTRKENGNGLGLTLTQNIVLNHKGNITVDSKPSKGTTFTISLNHAP